MLYTGYCALCTGYCVTRTMKWRLLPQFIGEDTEAEEYQVSRPSSHTEEVAEPLCCGQRPIKKRLQPACGHSQMPIRKQQASRWPPVGGGYLSVDHQLRNSLQRGSRGLTPAKGRGLGQGPQQAPCPSVVGVVIPTDNRVYSAWFSLQTLLKVSRLLPRLCSWSPRGTSLRVTGRPRLAWCGARQTGYTKRQPGWWDHHLSWCQRGAGPWVGPQGRGHWPPGHITHPVLPATDLMPLWVYGFITGLAVLLVGSVILLIVCMTRHLPGKGGGCGRTWGSPHPSFPYPLSPTPALRLCSERPPHAPPASCGPPLSSASAAQRLRAGWPGPSPEPHHLLSGQMASFPSHRLQFCKVEITMPPTSLSNCEDYVNPSHGARHLIRAHVHRRGHLPRSPGSGGRHGPLG